jgi:hypothetical protein
MILIYVTEINSRVEYIFDFLFKEILRVETRLTTDKNEFISSSDPKFSYGFEPMEGIFFKATDLLFEKDVHKIDFLYLPWQGIKVPFDVQGGVMPFDPFAASFYMVSRYEEYLPHIKDRHNRFKPEGSVAFKGEFLDRPVVNLWAEEIKKILLSHYSQIHFPAIPFTITPTIEVNKAYAYKNKGFLYTTGVLIEKLIKFDLKRFTKRFSVVLGYAEDPYDTYDRLHRINLHYNIKPYYFILSEDGSFNKKIPYSNQHLIALVKSIHAHYELGLHPVYSSKTEKNISKEKERLEGLISAPVTKNRFYSIKLSMPKSYQELIALGIKEDYSMGYATRIGFRAGTCTPFLFYDLEKEQKTDLRVYPFVLSDLIFRKYLHMRPREIVPFIKPIMQEVKKVGGNFQFIFHNESLGNDREWKNWGDTYEDVIKLGLSV